MAKRTIKTTAMSLDAKTMLPILLTGVEVITDDVAQQVVVIRKGEPPIVLHVPELFPSPEEKANGEAKATKKQHAAPEAEPAPEKISAPKESSPRTVKLADQCRKAGFKTGTVCVLDKGHEGHHHYESAAS